MKTEKQGIAYMLKDIQAHVRMTSRMIHRDTLDPRVLQAMEQVPRHQFVGPGLQDAAYEDGPLPIGKGQTISQPFIVALMTDLVGPAADARILEVGTGSGYQAAVLAQLVRQVYSIEIVPSLAAAAAEKFFQLGYRNIEAKVGDGYYGWPEQAPFDGILVTAAATYVPRPLVDQLKPGGKLVIPVGARYGGQDLLLLEKDAAGGVISREILPVAFVPLTGSHETVSADEDT